MNKTEYIAAVIFPILVFFAGCSFGPNPKEVLSKYLDNYFHGNYDKAYEFLSSKDKADPMPIKMKGHHARIDFGQMM